jgi:hypothetical protein
MKITTLNRVSLERLAPWLVLIITLLGAGLRLYQIGAKGLWLDEAFSVWLGWQPLPDMLSWIIRIDQHPPLYYFLLHFWMRFGDSAATVRTLSALIGALTIPMIYLLGRRLLGQNVALLAALILAISPFHIRFGQETRMYTLLTLNASLAMLALAHLLTDPQAAKTRLGWQLVAYFRSGRGKTTPSPRPDQPALTPANRGSSLQFIKTDLAWLGYIVFSAATMLTHNTALLFPIGVNLFVLGLIFFSRGQEATAYRLRPPSLKNWLMAQLGLLLLWSPWAAPFFVQAVGVYREFWLSPPDYKTVVWTVTNLLSVFLPGQIPDQFEWTDAVWIGYGLVALAGLYSLRRRPAHQFFLLSLFLTPFAGEWLVSLRRPIFYDRTLIYTSIPLYLLLAAGCLQLRYRPLILAAVVALMMVNSLSLREYFFKFEKEQWGEAAAYVAQNLENEDLLLFNASWVQIPFDFYFREFDRPVTRHGLPADLFDRGTLEPKMTPADLPRMFELIRGRERVWLVYSHNWYTDAHSLIPTALAEELELLEQKTFYGLEVRLYGRPGLATQGR